jgi:hypothetical protein
MFPRTQPTTQRSLCLRQMSQRMAWSTSLNDNCCTWKSLNRFNKYNRLSTKYKRYYILHCTDSVIAPIHWNCMLGYWYHANDSKQYCQSTGRKHLLQFKSEGGTQGWKSKRHVCQPTIHNPIDILLCSDSTQQFQPIQVWYPRSKGK